MSRVSQEELYNDKDVVTQILKLKDTVNDYAGGIIENIDVSGNDLVIDWADGTSISLPLPNPTGISSVTGTVSGGNLTITFYMTDGSSHAFTCPLNGMASEAYVDGLDAQNVKKTGSTVTGALEVPTTPPTPTSAVNDVYANDATDGVNNIMHKNGTEKIPGFKEMIPYRTKTTVGSNDNYVRVLKYKDFQGVILISAYGHFAFLCNYNISATFFSKIYEFIDGALVDYKLFLMQNNDDGEYELWIDVANGGVTNLMFYIQCMRFWTTSRTVNDYNSDYVVSSTDPSLDTAKYPRGKYYIPIKKVALS